jgi:hypothetical protein
MKAAIIRSYQDGVEYGDFEEPVAKTGEVIVKVKAAALSRRCEHKLPENITVPKTGFLSSQAWMAWELWRMGDGSISLFHLRRLDR